MQAVLENTSKYLKINGVKDTDKKSQYYKKTVFAGTEYSDGMTYSGSGAVVMLGGENSDEYNVALTKNSDVYVSDEYGENKLNLTNNYDDFRLFFNINKDKEIVIQSEEVDTNFLWVFHNDSDTLALNNLKKGVNASGKINIDNFFGDNEGVGEITDLFSFTANNTSIQLENYIDSIVNNVAGWLENHTDYADAMAVFGSDNTEDIQSLIAEYNIAYELEEIV